jgi:hypothetical protein
MGILSWYKDYKQRKTEENKQRIQSLLDDDYSKLCYRLKFRKDNDIYYAFFPYKNMKATTLDVDFILLNVTLLSLNKPMSENNLYKYLKVDREYINDD